MAAFLEHAHATSSNGTASSQDSAQHAARVLQSLIEAVSRARAADVVRQVDAALLRRLLPALAACMKAAEQALLPADGNEVSHLIMLKLTTHPGTFVLRS